MSIQLIFLIYLVFVLSACGPGADETTAADADDESAFMQQPGFPGEEKRDLVVISPRVYTGGTVKVKVTGFFEAEGSQALNLPASLTDEDQTWLQYGDSGAQDLNVLFTNSKSMAEHGVTVGEGPNTVTTNTNDECQSEVDVTATRVTGRYSCTGSMGYNNQTRQMGEVDVEVEFSADS